MQEAKQVLILCGRIPASYRELCFIVLNVKFSLPVPNLLGETVMQGDMCTFCITLSHLFSVIIKMC